MNNFKFIRRNVTDSIDSKFKENSVAVIYAKIRTQNYYVYMSKIVGIVHLEVPMFVKRYSCGTILLSIESLKIHNEILMEDSGIIEDIFVSEGQVVMYKTPLLLVRVEED